MSFETDGYLYLTPDDRVRLWVDKAKSALQGVDLRPVRHGRTWCVGVDALPNAADGSVGGARLDGPWRDHIVPPAQWHPAQVSVIYPGYPGRDAGESDAAHRFRRDRDAAHVDGLLPLGPDKRRYLKEPHGFILGLPLSDVTDSPLVVWQGSHKIMGAAFRAALAGVAPDAIAMTDLTEVYIAARRRCFETCPRVLLPAGVGAATLMHRHCLHGVAPWGGGLVPRPIAYFRPQISALKWLGVG